MAEVEQLLQKMQAEQETRKVKIRENMAKLKKALIKLLVSFITTGITLAVGCTVATKFGVILGVATGYITAGVLLLTGTLIAVIQGIQIFARSATAPNETP